MKQTRILLMAFVAMLTGLMVGSCCKENNNSGNGENNSDDNQGGGALAVEWVDLGLPSGLLWAKCNLGASVPEEYGNYYAWGETQFKEVYTWITYRYCTVDGVGEDGVGILQTLTKYNTSSSYGTPDNLTTLQAEDDAATDALGNGARTPTADEWRELINNTTVVWTTMNGVNGCKFIATNGNTLFLPAAGSHYDWQFEKGDGRYWSSSLHESDPHYAWTFKIESDLQEMGGTPRFTGQSVRPVHSTR